MSSDNPQNKEKKILYLVVGVAWLVSLGLMAGLAFPITGKIYERKDNLEESRLEVNSLKSDLSNGEKYQTLRESISESQELLERSVLKEATMVGFIEDLERTARDTGNSIVIAPYTPPKKKKGADKDEDESSTPSAAQPAAPADEESAKNAQYFQLTLKGSYGNFLSFLAKLENMGYVFKINSIEAKTTASNNKVSLRAQQENTEPTGAAETRIIISFSLSK